MVGDRQACPCEKSARRYTGTYGKKNPTSKCTRICLDCNVCKAGNREIQEKEMFINWDRNACSLHRSVKLSRKTGARADGSLTVLQCSRVVKNRRWCSETSSCSYLASCLRGALTSVDLRAVYLARVILS